MIKQTTEAIYRNDVNPKHVYCPLLNITNPSERYSLTLADLEKNNIAKCLHTSRGMENVHDSKTRGGTYRLPDGFVAYDRFSAANVDSVLVRRGSRFSSGEQYRGMQSPITDGTIEIHATSFAKIKSLCDLLQLPFDIK